MYRFHRRNFLKGTGILGLQLLSGSTILTLSNLAKADASLPVQSLLTTLNPADAVLVVPTTAGYANYQTSFNKRTQVNTAVRALVKNASGVAACLKWAADNNISFSVRGGGHSYEGYSQNEQLVIDMRLVKNVSVDSTNQTAVFGAGFALGEVYQVLTKAGFIIPGGSCPTVGIVGHATGGGFGLLARKLGLACDNVKSAQMVDARGNILTLSENENSDLFWAIRGGGNGQFGVVTQLEFNIHPITQVIVYGVGWDLSADKALKVFEKWQQLAPNLVDDIASLMKISKSPDGNVALRCIGQTTGALPDLKTFLQNLIAVELTSAPVFYKTEAMADAISHFAGAPGYPSVFMKGKSDYLTAPMSTQGVQMLISQIMNLPAGTVEAMCDAYGGAINRVASDAMAFFHRNTTQYSIQYYSQWGSAGSTDSRLQMIRSLYTAMRPYVSGQCYVNYCDMDIADYRTAYWGDNVPRLQQIKAMIDPLNIFKHKQGI